MCRLKVMLAVFPQPILIPLISAPKGNPYLVNWFNPSIAVVHGLVSVTDKWNVISGVGVRRRCGGAEPGNSRNSRPNVSAGLAEPGDSTEDGHGSGDPGWSSALELRPHPDAGAALASQKGSLSQYRMKKKKKKIVKCPVLMAEEILVVNNFPSNRLNRDRVCSQGKFPLGWCLQWADKAVLLM